MRGNLRGSQGFLGILGILEGSWGFLKILTYLLWDSLDFVREFWYFILRLCLKQYIFPNISPKILKESLGYSTSEVEKPPEDIGNEQVSKDGITHIYIHQPKVDT